MNNALAQLKAAAGITTVVQAQSEPEPDTSKTPLKALTNEEKLKALAAVGKRLNDQFKTTNALVRLGSRPRTILPHFTTGIPSLDHGVIGIGGIPKGRIIEIYGPESAGKTTLTLEIVAEEQRNGSLCAFVDAEHALDPNYARQLGVDVDNLYLSQPDSGEQALETVEALVNSRAVSIVVVDSVAALVPQAELDGEMGDSHMGLQARMMSQACRKLRGICAINGVTVIFINQIREKIGVMYGSPEVTTGGRALKFFATLRLDVRRIGGDNGKIMSGGVLVGHKMKIKAQKNKVFAPYKETEVDVIYGKGIDRFADLVRFAVTNGVIQKNGSWLSYGGEKLGQGSDNAIDALRNSPELVTKIKDDVDKAIAAQREVDAQ